MQWTELETYRQLLQEYERRRADYEKLLESYRAQQAAGNGDQPDVVQVKEQLDRELPEIEALYNRLRAIRSELAQARDAAVAQ